MTVETNQLPANALDCLGAPPMAMVLCGGGSRGAMEVGLYQALTEFEVRADFILGCSIGALNGAFIAGGMAPSELVRLWSEFRLSAVLGINWAGLRPWRRIPGLLSLGPLRAAAADVAGHPLRGPRRSVDGRHYRFRLGLCRLLARKGRPYRAGDRLHELARNISTGGNRRAAAHRRWACQQRSPRQGRRARRSLSLLDRMRMRGTVRPTAARFERPLDSQLLDCSRRQICR